MPSGDCSSHAARRLSEESRTCDRAPATGQADGLQPVRRRLLRDGQTLLRAHPRQIPHLHHRARIRRQQRFVAD
jgi:hypothetical protein